MAITQRGEIEAAIGGETRMLCLTLGALAELEARLQPGIWWGWPNALPPAGFRRAT